MSHRDKIWNIAASKFPEATQIVDLFHAREHLHDLTRKQKLMLLDRKGEEASRRWNEICDPAGTQTHAA